MAELHPSGAEVMLAISASAFADLGVTGSIVATGAERGPYADRLAEAGWDIHHVPSPGGLSGFRGHLRTLGDLAAQHDVVHLHSEGATLPYALSARRRGLPVVRTVHNVFSFTGALRAERTVWRALQRRAGVVQIACSRAVRDNEASTFRNPVEVVPNWFDPSRFALTSAEHRAAARRTLGITDEQRVAVIVGNCGPLKNHEGMLQAVADVGDPNLLVLHAGAEQADSERRLVRDGGAQDAVRFLGSVDDIASLLAAADLYLMASFAEGQSIAALEALATGLPALFSARGGMLDHQDVLPEGAAVWVEPEPDAIAGALRDWLDGRWGKVPGADIRAPIIRDYGIETGAANYVRFYRLAVASNQGARG